MTVWCAGLDETASHPIGLLPLDDKPIAVNKYYYYY
jgi:hypothetical protein